MYWLIFPNFLKTFLHIYFYLISLRLLENKIQKLESKNSQKRRFPYQKLNSLQKKKILIDLNHLACLILFCVAVVLFQCFTSFTKSCIIQITSFQFISFIFYHHFILYLNSIVIIMLHSHVLSSYFIIMFYRHVISLCFSIMFYCLRCLKVKRPTAEE